MGGDGAKGRQEAREGGDTYIGKEERRNDRQEKRRKGVGKRKGLEEGGRGGNV